jgi:hypothetical protein
MQDIDSALNDINRIRNQLAASSRFEGFAPKIVALSGVLALGLAALQSRSGDESLLTWIVLAAISATMIGTEAIVRARIYHCAMADRMLSATLQRFMPTAMAGAVIGLVVLLRLPEHVQLLPGLWQILMGVGIFSVLGGLPEKIIWAAGFYFASGTLSLLASASSTGIMPWLMGIPFGAGQLLVAAILHFSARYDRHDE